MGAWYCFSCGVHDWYSHRDQQRERKTEVRKNSLQMRIQNWYVQKKTQLEELFWRQMMVQVQQILI